MKYIFEIMYTFKLYTSANIFIKIMVLETNNRIN